MFPVWSDVRLVEAHLHVLHIEAEHERLVQTATAQYARERADARRLWLASRLIRLGHALEPHGFSDDSPIDIG
jgi:hypothetical protein